MGDGGGVTGTVGGWGRGSGNAFQGCGRSSGVNYSVAASVCICIGVGRGWVGGGGFESEGAEQALVHYL